MAYPVSGNYQARVSGVTVISKAWGDELDANMNGLYGATRTVKGIALDATGYTAEASPATPTIECFSAHDLAVKAAVGQVITFNRRVHGLAGLRSTGGDVEIEGSYTWTATDSAMNYGSGTRIDSEVYGTGSKLLHTVVIGSEDTTDGATTVVPITYPMPSDKAVHITTTLIAIDSAFGAALMKMEADAFRRTGGVTTNVAAKDLYTATDEIGVTSYGWAINGANLEYQIVGKAATTIRWMVRAEILFIG